MAKPYEESKIYQTRICQVSELNPALQKYLQFQIPDNEKILYCVEGQVKLSDSIFYYACILTQNEVISVTSDIVPGSGGIMSGDYSHVVLVEEKTLPQPEQKYMLEIFFNRPISANTTSLKLFFENPEEAHVFASILRKMAKL